MRPARAGARTEVSIAKIVATQTRPDALSTGPFRCSADVGSPGTCRSNGGTGNYGSSASARDRRRSTAM